MSAAQSNPTGIVFNLQRYSLHDGPGIRTVVFFKGCPLRCRWCSNPESHHAQPELGYMPDRCLGFEACTRCREVCPRDAIDEDEVGRARVNRDACDDCLDCVESCPPRALRAYGETMTVDQVVSAAEADDAFYSRSGGGLTLSGGEPLFQPEFALAVLAEARRRRLNTALETCGHVPADALDAAARQVDTLLFDLKLADPERHREWTGVDNARLLDNLRRVRADLPELDLLVRTPIVPGVNDTAEDLRAIRELLAALPHPVRHELLPYHRLGAPKCANLGREYPLGEVKLAEERYQSLCALMGAPPEPR